MRFTALLVGFLLSTLLSFTEAQCRIKCGPKAPDDPEPADGSGSVARSLFTPRALEEICNPYEDSQCGSGLERRALDVLTAESLPQYVVVRTDAVEKNKGGIMFRDDASTSRSTKLGRNSFDFGMSGLCGCTLLIVVSKTRVFGGHFFETLAFDDRTPKKKKNTANFQGNCLDFLDGTNTQDLVQGPSLKSFAGDFPVGETKAYIMSIDVAGEGADTGKLYETQVNQMADHVNEIIGTRPTLLWYNPVDSGIDATRSSPELDTERGRALYQYDVDKTTKAKTHRFIFQSTQIFAEQITD